MGRGRPRYPDVLTPREFEVLALLRSGLTNDEIAQRLGITQRTAKYHVSEIIGKLGVTDRRTAALWEPDVPAPRAWLLAPVGWLFRKLPGISLSSAASSGPAVVGSVGLLSTAFAGLGLIAFLLLRSGSGGPVGPGSAHALPANASVPVVASAVVPLPSVAAAAAGSAPHVVLAGMSTPTGRTEDPSATTPSLEEQLLGVCSARCDASTPTTRDSLAPTATPTAVLNFAIGVDVDGDGTNDCGTGAPMTVGDGIPDAVVAEVSDTGCIAAADALLTVRVYLMDTGGISYAGLSSRASYAGFESLDIGAVHWPCRAVERSTSGPHWESAGQDLGGVSGSSDPCTTMQPQTSLGLFSEFTLGCSQGGTLVLSHGAGATALKDAALYEHLEAGADVLSITCGDRTPLPASSPQVSITQRAALPAG